MEESAQEQRKIAECIAKMKINFTKDGKIRKEKGDYYEKKLGNLEELWKEYETRHIQITDYFYLMEPNNAYFKNNEHGQTKKSYLDLKHVLKRTSTDEPNNNYQEILIDQDNISKILRNVFKTLEHELKTITKEDLIKRLTEFTSMWTVFERNHQTLLENINEIKSDYFTNNFFDKVKEFYQKNQIKYKETLDELEKLEEEKNEAIALKESSYRFLSTGEPMQFNNGSFTMNQDVCDQKIKLQISRSKIMRAFITQISNSTIVSDAFYKQKIISLREKWKNFSETHEQIIAEMDNFDLEQTAYFMNNVYQETENLFEDTIIQIQEKLDNRKQQEHPSENLNIKLPTINIPVFSGKYNEWTSFYDIYRRLIHDNKTLSECQKMHYLKTQVTGDAAKLIQHLQITKENYSAAWFLLNNRYDNKRKMVSTQLDLLLGQRELKTESASGLRNMLDITRETLFAMANLGVDTSSWGPIVAHIMIKKLDPESHKQYEQSLEDPKEVQELQAFLMFLETRFQILEALGTSSSKFNNTSNKGNSWNNWGDCPKIPQPAPLQKRNPTFNNYHITSTIKCVHCSGSHALEKCEFFLRMGVDMRNKLVTDKQICAYCFSREHKTLFCKAIAMCGICQQRHNTLLHLNKTVTQKGPTRNTNTFGHVATNADPIKTEETSFKIQNMLSEVSEPTNILLGTAMVRTNSTDGTEQLLRLLIDPGSQASFITEEAANRLRLPRQIKKVQISGVGATNAGSSKGMVDITLAPRFSSNFKLKMKALVLKELTQQLPEKSFNGCKWTYLQNLLWADPTFDKTGPIDILLGADHYSEIIKSTVVKGQKLEPMAQETEFGWVILGNTAECGNNTKAISMMTNVEIDSQLKKFWELEELPKTTPYTKEEQLCEEFFQNNFYRQEDGRYVVRIPFKENDEKLGLSKNRALARFLQVEKRLTQNPDLKNHYLKFMQEYIDLGHMELVKSPSSDAYYLPHHAVFKEASTTTKVRVVFDASAKTSSGISLNDIMMTGPTLQAELTSIILRWRKPLYVYTADIEKMFRQINIDPRDRDYQRILWRKSPTEPINEYRLKTVTYGTAAATYLAVRALQQLAKDDQDLYPKAAQSILNDFYVDDLMSGSDTIADGLNKQHQLIEMLRGGGFNLRKWTSNNEALLQQIPTEAREHGDLHLNPDDSIKTLGIYWSPVTDTFSFKVNLMEDNNSTSKRKILSEASKLFDPLGWLAPIIIRAKLILQDLWLAGVDWDQKLPNEVSEKWLNYKTALKSIEAIKIKRWIGTKIINNSCELHGFCDASEGAYAAAIYCRVTDKDGEVTVSLLTAKTKVAPIKKKLTIPRLELCGALLLSKLITTIVRTMEFSDAVTYAWTDSSIALAWIKGDANRWKSFVANRVMEIQDGHPAEWNHINSEDNPADCASRGVNPEELVNHSLWWNGPNWLKFRKEEWRVSSVQETEIIKQQKLKEAKNIKKSVNSYVTNFDDNNLSLLSKFSTLCKLKRVVAYIQRFIRNLKISKKERIISSLTTDELKAAMNTVLKLAQQKNFATEISQLLQGEQLAKTSKLVKLHPFIDKNNILRVGGRLEAADIPYDQKHPVIIDYQSPLTTLIVDWAHKITLHGGNQLTLAHIRNEYWIVRAKNAVRKTLQKCIRCHRYRQLSSEQLMGELPHNRVNPSRPFNNTGVDYAGPIQIRMSKGRGNKSYKGYISIFVCLATKAIHLEAVSDLTTQGFLAAFRRFVSRRGLCSNIYSDNGTNFIGAKSELERELRKAITNQREEVATIIANDYIRWHFIPPHAPTFGGLWEAAVKSTKYHLKRVFGDTTLTFEELTTALTQIEACLNSRPLCSLSNDPDDLEALTPGHFLVGAPLLSVPTENLENKNSVRSRWQLLNQINQRFWKRWSSEYLTQLYQRTKWSSERKNIQKGSLVLVKDDQLPPSKWQLGRIEETHPGKDQLVRVVTIKTKESQIKRPITKIIVLPIDPHPGEDGLMRTTTNKMVATSTLQNHPSLGIRIS